MIKSGTCTTCSTSGKTWTGGGIMAAEPQPMRRSLCARILAAGRDDIVRFSPGTQRDMQSRLWESGLSFSNTERVENSALFGHVGREIGGGGGANRFVGLTRLTS